MANGTPLDGSKAPLKFLFVSLENLSGDLAWTIKKERHEVKCYIKAKSDADVYAGFVEKVEKWEDFADWADVICFDDVEFGEAAEKLRKKGTERTFSSCWSKTKTSGRRKPRSSFSSGTFREWRLRSALISTARISSTPLTSILSTNGFSPEISARSPARWARFPSGASPMRFSAPRSKRCCPPCRGPVTSSTSTSTAS